MENSIDASFYRKEIMLVQGKEKRHALNVAKLMLSGGKVVAEMEIGLRGNAQALAGCGDLARHMTATSDNMVAVFEQFDRLLTMFENLLDDLEANQKHQSRNPKMSEE